MEYPRLETARLADVDDSFYYGAHCSACRHGRRISLVRLRARLGADYPLRDVRRRLRCQACGARAIVVTFLGPHHAVGGLRELFAKAPV